MQAALFLCSNRLDVVLRAQIEMTSLLVNPRVVLVDFGEVRLKHPHHFGIVQSAGSLPVTQNGSPNGDLTVSQKVTAKNHVMGSPNAQYLI
jgi:hypothetical protein